jgi:hypothetical protein
MCRRWDTPKLQREIEQHHVYRYPLEPHLQIGPAAHDRFEAVGRAVRREVFVTNTRGHLPVKGEAQAGNPLVGQHKVRIAAEHTDEAI